MDGTAAYPGRSAGVAYEALHDPALREAPALVVSAFIDVLVLAQDPFHGFSASQRISPVASTLHSSGPELLVPAGPALGVTRNEPTPVCVSFGGSWLPTPTAIADSARKPPGVRRTGST